VGAQRKNEVNPVCFLFLEAELAQSFSGNKKSTLTAGQGNFIFSRGSSKENEVNPVFSLFLKVQLTLSFEGQPVITKK